LQGVCLPSYLTGPRPLVWSHPKVPKRRVPFCRIVSLDSSGRDLPIRTAESLQSLQQVAFSLSSKRKSSAIILLIASREKWCAKVQATATQVVPLASIALHATALVSYQ